MIQKISKGVGGLVARFGGGTVRIHAYLLQTRFGGQVELTQCKKTPLGENAPSISGGSKIVLDFSSVESLDLFITKLEALRSDLVNEVA